VRSCVCDPVGRLVFEMLDQITPVILTYNEAPNIARTLAKLAWARDIVVVDSFSDDQTLSIALRAPNVRVFQRKFDCLANQWNFAIGETGITSEWALALDADYMVTSELRDEMAKLQPDSATNGYRVRFGYSVNGHRLRGSAYPPSVVLYRRRGATYFQDGHAQRLSIDGVVETLQSIIVHDDHKDLDQWLTAQGRYAKLEVEKLRRAKWGELGWSDRIRRLRIVAPFAMLIYCLVFRGLILDGRAGFSYAFQRMLAELLLSIYMFQPPEDERVAADGESSDKETPRPVFIAAKQ
jgi:glycosyltransferase involved in cell wall biosynthesis